MIPGTVKVRGHVYKVKQVSAKALGGDHMADVDNDLQVIRLLRRASEAQKVELLLHEVLHAMLAGRSVGDEEQLASHLGEEFTSFLWNNSAFIHHALHILNH